jgi:hypothetical protein
MEEGRKRVIGIMAAILAARKLGQQDSTRASPASSCAIHDAVVFAERIMRAIDQIVPPTRNGA